MNLLVSALQIIAASTAIAAALASILFLVRLALLGQIAKKPEPIPTGTEDPQPLTH